MKTLWALTIVGVISGAAVPSASAAGAATLIITSSNAANNTLLVYDTQGTLLQALPTGGKEVWEATPGALPQAGTRSRW